MSSADEPINPETETTAPPRRLCSEIQLFDLCELERCRFKDGRFCTDSDLLARFEAVAEPQDRPTTRFDDDDDDDPEEFDEDDDGYDDFDDEDQQEKNEEW